MTHCGPGIGYSSAAAAAVSPGSPIVEMLLCALGYAAAIGLCASMVARRGGLLLACVVAVLLVVALGRYYKWYYWLVPIVSLWSALGVLETRAALRCGLVAGVAWLFRIEIGLASFAIAFAGVGAAAVCEAGTWRSVAARCSRGVFLVLAGASVPIGLWTVLLGSRGGAGAVVDQYRFYFDAAGDLVGMLALPPFPFDWSDPVGPANRTAVVQVFAVATVVLATAVGAAGLWRKKSEGRPTLLACGVVGAAAAAVLPQAFHRADAPHLAQVLPPLLLAWAFVFSAVRGGGTGFPGRSQGCPRARGRLEASIRPVAWVLGLGWAAGLVFLPLPNERRPVWDDPIGRLTRMAGADLTGLESTFAEMLVAANTLTGPGDRVLFLPREGLICEAQVYYWVDRPMAGNLQAYYLGLFATPPWPVINAGLVEQAPPAIVIAERRFIREGYRNETLDRYHPELLAFVRPRYTRVVFENEVWMLLATDAPTNMDSGTGRGLLDGTPKPAQN